MQHFKLFRHACRLMVGMSACISFCLVASCTDDTFTQHRATGLLLFDVEAPTDWGSGSARVADEDISIRKMSTSAGDQPLYLITEITDANSSTTVSADGVVTRGTPITKDNFPTSFGLSAICYTGTWSDTDADNWPVNFAYNLKVEKGGTAWHVAGDEKLNWVGSGNIKFYAYLPYSTNESGIVHSSQSAKGVPALTYTVPTEVAKQPDLMVATADCGGNGTGDAINSAGHVTLTFKHVLTAINIKAGKNMLAGKITSVSISGVHGKGSYKMGDTKWTMDATTPPATYTATLKKDGENEGIDLPVDKGGNKDNIYTGSGTSIIVDNECTFMMLPQTLPDNAKLTVQFTDSLTKTERTLTADLKGSTWGIGKKVTYSISSKGILVEPQIDISIDRQATYPEGMLPMSGYLHNVGLNARVRVVQAGQVATKTFPIKGYTLQYSTDGGTSWQDANGKDENYGWKPKDGTLTGDKLYEALADTKTPVAGSLSLPAQSSFTALRNKFKTITETGKGTESAPWDLVENNDPEESANCYIVNDHGYYTFPLVYGNSINKANYKPYTYQGSNPNDKVLQVLTDYNNNLITQNEIQNAKDAIIIWQDTPDLVTDVTLNDTKDAVLFRVPRPSLGQGNAIIAVRDDGGTIIWSWHIWATPADWSKSGTQKIKAIVTGNHGGDGTHHLAPCNLGYCDRRGANEERNIQIRFKITMLDGTTFVTTDTKTSDSKVVTIQSTNAKTAATTRTGSAQTREEATKGFVTLKQEAVVASVAGDNPYYQWGRKDPMLPGIYNRQTLDEARANYGTDETKVEYIRQFDMQNKPFYATREYEFGAAESGVTIGKSIQEPHHFFIHTATKNDASGTIENYLRRHWYNGGNDGRNDSDVATKRPIMNFWNLHHDVECKSNDLVSPNGDLTIKTIYDPCPAGYKVPEPNVFSLFCNRQPGKFPVGTQFAHLLTNPEKKPENVTLITDQGICIGWNVNLYDIVPKSDGTGGMDTTMIDNKVFFPATGLRDMGLGNKHYKILGEKEGSWPAHSCLTFIATSGFQGDSSGSSCLLFSLDNRSQFDFIEIDGKKVPMDKGSLGISINLATNNAYGFSIRPIRDE